MDDRCRMMGDGSYPYAERVHESSLEKNTTTGIVAWLCPWGACAIWRGGYAGPPALAPDCVREVNTSDGSPPALTPGCFGDACLGNKGKCAGPPALPPGCVLEVSTSDVTDASNAAGMAVTSDCVLESADL